MEQHIIQSMAATLQIQQEQIQSTLRLLEEGNTVPFIARYRKEVTHGLDEEQIRVIQEQYDYQVNLEKRKEDVLRLIEQQGKLTEEIKTSVAACQKLSQVEDIYRPYQQKRKTRASEAINKGLKPFAEWMLKLLRDGDVWKEAEAYVNDKVSTPEDAIQGAKDIIAEMASDFDYSSFLQIYQNMNIKHCFAHLSLTILLKHYMLFCYLYILAYLFVYQDPFQLLLYIINSSLYKHYTVIR